MDDISDVPPRPVRQPCSFLPTSLAWLPHFIHEVIAALKAKLGPGAWQSDSLGRGRFAITSAVAVAVSLVLVATLVSSPRPRLVWNLSPSSPRGLYLVTRNTRPHVGETIIAWPPQAARRLASVRHYLPANVPLVKPVAATAGDKICAGANRIFINGRGASLRRGTDPVGRAMPRWIGCHRLQSGELFLLSRGSPLAFDGRYFGVTRASEVVGVARMLWPR
jgi:conjugative transfer signal peptidase TraF